MTVRTKGDKHQGANETELQLSPGTKINKLSANVGIWRSYSRQTLRSKETEEPLCNNSERKKIPNYFRDSIWYISKGLHDVLPMKHPF